MKLENKTINIVNRDEVLTDPKKLVRQELANCGFDLDNMKVPHRVFLLADSLYDEMLAKNCGTYQYPLGGKLYVFDENEDIGFVKANMCSPAIATQAEDLIAGGVKELIHIGFSGGLQTDMKAGDVVISDGAYNDTAVARLYGYDVAFIESSNELTDHMRKSMLEFGLEHRRGGHWTTDAGYHETWGQVLDHREKGALCVEMEGAGLFTIAKYRNCKAAVIYVVSDVYDEKNWNLGWGEDILANSIQNVLDWIASTV